jgi:hypothetical protein
MFEFVTQHQFWAAVAIYWIFSTAVSSMPEPASGGSSGYQWIYRFLHTVAGNVTTVFAGKISGAVFGFVVTMAAKEKLNLLQFASCNNAQPGASAAKIMGARFPAWTGGESPNQTYVRLAGCFM